jgi:hypothetical protein
MGSTRCSEFETWRFHVSSAPCRCAKNVNITIMLLKAIRCVPHGNLSPPKCTQDGLIFPLLHPSPQKSQQRRVMGSLAGPKIKLAQDTSWEAFLVRKCQTAHSCLFCSAPCRSRKHSTAVLFQKIFARSPMETFPGPKISWTQTRCGLPALSRSPKHPKSSSVRKPFARYFMKTFPLLRNSKTQLQCFLSKNPLCRINVPPVLLQPDVQNTPKQRNVKNRV